MLDLCRRTSSATHRSPSARPRRTVLRFQSGSSPELWRIKANADPETHAKTDATKHSVVIRFPNPDVQFHWHGCGVALSFAMASEVPVIEPEALQSRVRELRRFL